MTNSYNLVTNEGLKALTRHQKPANRSKCMHLISQLQKDSIICSVLIRQAHSVFLLFCLAGFSLSYEELSFIQDCT